MKAIVSFEKRTTTATEDAAHNYNLPARGKTRTLDRPPRLYTWAQIVPATHESLLSHPALRAIGAKAGNRNTKAVFRIMGSMTESRSDARWLELACATSLLPHQNVDHENQTQWAERQAQNLLPPSISDHPLAQRVTLPTCLGSSWPNKRHPCPKCGARVAAILGHQKNAAQNSPKLAKRVAHSDRTAIVMIDGPELLSLVAWDA